MALRVWSKLSSDYGRKLLDSGIEGAHSGEEAFLDGKPLTPFLNESVCSAVTPAVLGAFIGALSSYMGQRKSVARRLAYGLLGGAIGLTAGLAWESRRLTASMADGALRNIGKARDEHWLEKHPIDYA